MDEAWHRLSPEHQAVVDEYHELINLLDDQIDELDGCIRDETNERAHEQLRTTYEEIAEMLGASEVTLHRWRSGESTPSAVYRRQGERLADFLTALEGRFSDPVQAEHWARSEQATLDGVGALEGDGRGGPEEPSSRTRTRRRGLPPGHRSAGIRHGLVTSARKNREDHLGAVAMTVC